MVGIGRIAVKFNQFRSGYEKELGEALAGVDPQQVERARDEIIDCHGTIWLIGNGGSASLASHMATDLCLAGKRAIALTDIAAITTAANDHSYQDSFSQQVKYLTKREDLLIAISGSGYSGNIVQAVTRFPGRVIALTGLTGGTLEKMARMTGFKGMSLHIPTKGMGVAQDCQQIILHEITYSMMEGRK